MKANPCIRCGTPHHGRGDVCGACDGAVDAARMWRLAAQKRAQMAAVHASYGAYAVAGFVMRDAYEFYDNAERALAQQRDSM